MLTKMDKGYAPGGVAGVSQHLNESLGWGCIDEENARNTSLPRNLNTTAWPSSKSDMSELKNSLSFRPHGQSCALKIFSLGHHPSLTYIHDRALAPATYNFDV
jgi:hypothetical protein